MNRKPSPHRDPNAHVIHAPGQRLLRHVPLRSVWNQVTGRGRRGTNASLNLVSFIDFLVVTVIFLLMSFSASGQCKARDVDTPRAGNVEDMVDAPMVVVSHGQVLVDGTAAGAIRSIEDEARPKKIDELFNLLKSKRELYRQLQPNRPFPGVCILAIDEGVPAVVVKSVFQTAAYAGYPSVSFMVKKITAMR